MHRAINILAVLLIIMTLLLLVWEMQYRELKKAKQHNVETHSTPVERPLNAVRTRSTYKR